MTNSCTCGLGFLAMALVVGCGGGQGSNATSVPVRELVVITSSNQSEVVSDSLKAGFSSARIGDMSGLGVLGIEHDRFQLGPVGVQFNDRFDYGVEPPIGAHVGPIVQQCASAGSMTVTGNMSLPGLGLTVGDNLCMVFTNCDDGHGLLIDGMMDVVINGFQGSIVSGQLRLEVSVVLTDLVLTESDEVMLVNGGFHAATNSLSSPIVETSTDGGPLSFIFSDRTIVLDDFSNSFAADSGVFPTAYEMDFSGVLSSSRFDGVAEYKSILSFVWFSDKSPYAGEMLITGANNSTIRVIALDLEMVRLQMDYNGDGAVDETRDVTWDEAIS